MRWPHLCRKIDPSKSVMAKIRICITCISPPPFNIGSPQLLLWEAVVKRVSLCRVAVDWPAEGQAGGSGMGTWKFWHYLGWRKPEMVV